MQKKIQRQTKIQYSRVTYEDSEATGMQGAISPCIKKPKKTKTTLNSNILQKA